MLKFVKRIVFVVGAVFIFLIVLGLLLPHQEPPRPSQSATSEQPVAVQASTTPTRAQPKITKVTWLSASQLANAYESNEIAADNVFKGHTVAVKGQVKSIGKDILGQPYVTFSSGNEGDFRSVQAFFPSDQKDELASFGVANT